MTLARFDGDHGEYSIFLGKAKGIEGPFSRGSYVWVSVCRQSIKRNERTKKTQTYVVEV